MHSTRFEIFFLLNHFLFKRTITKCVGFLSYQLKKKDKRVEQKKQPIFFKKNLVAKGVFLSQITKKIPFLKKLKG